MKYNSYLKDLAIYYISLCNNKYKLTFILTKKK